MFCLLMMKDVVKYMTWNTSPKCPQDELNSVEEGEVKVTRTAEFYEDFDLLRSVNVRVEICYIQPDNTPIT